MSLMLSMCNEVKQVYLLNVTRTIEMEIPSAHLTVPHFFFRIKHCTNFFHYFFQNTIYSFMALLLKINSKLSLLLLLLCIDMNRLDLMRRKKHHFSFTRLLKFSKHQCWVIFNIIFFFIFRECGNIAAIIALRLLRYHSVHK